MALFGDATIPALGPGRFVYKTSIIDFYCGCIMVWAGRDLSIWGWARNKGALGSHEILTRLLMEICSAIGMRPLRAMHVEIPPELERLQAIPFEDEGGASAVLLLSTSHAGIHGWPLRANRSDGGFFMLNIQSCRDFDPEVVKTILKQELQTTAIYSKGGRIRVPPPGPIQ